MERPNNIFYSIALALAFLVTDSGASATAAENDVQLNWQLAPTDKAGSVKSGAACFPNGSLLWREVAKPDPAILDSRLQALLQSRELGLYRVSGDIASVKAMVCSPWLGIGAKPKSEIKLSIRWTFQSADGQTRSATVETSIARKQYDLRSDPALLLEAVEASLQKSLLAI